MYSFNVESHIRDAVTDLVAHKDNTNNTAPNVLEMGAYQAISLNDAERPVATHKIKREKNVSLEVCLQNNF